MNFLNYYNYFLVFGVLFIIIGTIVLIYKKNQLKSAKVINGKITDVKMSYTYAAFNNFYPVIGIYKGKTLIHSFKAPQARAQYGFYDVGDMIEVYEITKGDRLKFFVKKGYYRMVLTLYGLGVLLFFAQLLTIE